MKGITIEQIRIANKKIISGERPVGRSYAAQLSQSQINEFLQKAFLATQR